MKFSEFLRKKEEEEKAFYEANREQYETEKQNTINHYYSQNNQNNTNQNVSLWDTVNFIKDQFMNGMQGSVTHTIGSVPQSLATGYQKGINQLNKEQSVMDNVLNNGKNVVKAMTSTDPTARLLYNLTIGRDDYINELMQNAQQIQENIDKADNPLGKVGAVLGGISSKAITDYNPVVQSLYNSGEYTGHLIGKENAEKTRDKLLEIDENLNKENDKWSEELAKESEKYDEVTKALGSGAQSIGAMTPSIALSAIGGGAGLSQGTAQALGLVQMGLSAKGSKTREGLKQGLDLETADRKGVASGSTEVGTEMMWGGLKAFNKFKKSGFEDTARQWIEKSVENKLKSSLGKKLTKKVGNWLLDVTGESIEEVASGIYNTWLDNATNDPNKQYTFEDLTNDTVGAIIATTGLNTLYSGVNKVSSTFNKTNTNTQNYKESVNTNTQNFEQSIKNGLNETLNAQINRESTNNASNKQIYDESARQYNIDTNNKTVQSLQQFGENRGLQVEYNADMFKNNNEESIWVDDGNSRHVYINPNGNGETALNKLAVHEMFHDTIGSRPHDKLTKLVMDKLSQDNSYNTNRNSIIEAYKDQLQGLNEKQANNLINEEMTSKYLAENLGNQEFVNELIETTEKNTIEKVIDWIDNRIEQVKNLVTGNKEAEYWRKVRENVVKAYNSKYQGTEGTLYNKTPIKESRQVLQENFKALTGDSITQADAKLAGIEMRNLQRENGNLDGELETNPYNKEAMEIYNKYKNNRKSSQYLYHSTSKDNIKSILEKGLTTGNKQNQEGVSSKNNIYLSATEELAQSFAPQDNVTLRINPKVKLENLSNDLLGGEGSYTITNNIPADMLQVKENGKWINLTESELSNQILAKNQNSEYNTDNEIIEPEEYKNYHNKKLDSIVIQHHGNDVLDFDYVFDANNFYVINNEDRINYKILDVLEINDQNRKIINEYIKKVEENYEANRSGTRLDEMSEASQRKFEDGNNNNVNVEGEQTWTDYADEILNKYGESYRKDDSSKNNAIKTKSIESQEGSFNLPKKDNQGRTLTKEQQEFFKDSKVRDENGKLLTVYHGTNSDKFTIFDKNKFNSNEKSGDYVGEGFYFTANKNRAKRYGNKNIVEAYLDIKNPIIINTEEDAWNFRDIFKGEYEATQEEKAQPYFESMSKMNGFDYFELQKNNPSKIREILENRGYDGLIDNLYGQYAVFNPNQIKNVDNTNPTENPDIRYNKKSTFDEYLKEHTINKEVGDTIKDVKIPIKEKVETKIPVNKEIVKKNTRTNNQIVENTKEFFNREMYDELTSNNDMFEGVTETDLKEGLKQLYQTQLDEELSSTNYKEDSNRKHTYMQYKNVNTQYNESILQNALDKVKANRNDKRTVKQWLEVAKQIGLNSGDLSSKEIQDLAYGSWFDLKPNTHDSITKYDNVAKQNVPFQKFTSDDWVNTIYENAKQSKMQQFEEILNKKQKDINPPINEDLVKENENTQGEPVNWLEIERPTDDKKFRKHYKSIIESSNTTAEAKKIAKEIMGLDTYVPDSNKAQLQRADNTIATLGADKSLEGLKVKLFNNDRITPVDIAIGERLIEYYSKTGSRDNLQDAIESTALMGTQAGQTVQALAILNHQTPTGQVSWIQRSIDKANKELQDKFAKKNKETPQFEFTSEMQQKILNTENQEQMFKAIDEVYEELGKQVPKNHIEQLDEWRYFSMLANVKTHLRNMIGNVAMHGIQRTKDKIAGGIEDVVANFNPNMERTHTLRKVSKEIKEFAKKDVKNMDTQTMLGMNENKYNPQSRLQGSRITFKSDIANKTLGKAFDLNSTALEVEDNIGLKAMYVKALGEYITANKIDINNMTDKQLAKARNYAVQSAKEATFHQASSLATALNQMGRKNNIAKFALDAVVPFKKTPINVAKTGVQYSPVGLLKSAVYDIGKLRKGNITVNQYIDNVSKGLTGTGITFLGYALAQAGILKASGEDDDKKEKYDEEQGKQSYSLQIGDKTYSLDWLAPAGIPLFIGAEINQQFNQTKKEKNVEGNEENQVLSDIVKRVANISNGMANAMNPMSEMSMISGLTNVLSSYNKENAVGDMIVNTGKSYINQYVPTLLGQIARTGDDYERTTKSTKTGAVEKAVDSTINQIKSKIPRIKTNITCKNRYMGK